MRRSTNWILAAILAFIVHTVVGQERQADGADPSQDPKIKETLQAMNVDDTWSHPDIYWEYVGMHRYAHRDYAKAMESFVRAAYYADKLSELCIGLMYLNGEGTAPDAATAYAWMDIAAERGYPEFVATRDRVWASMPSEQRERAQVLRAAIAQKYADEVAKPRMAQQLRFALEGITGSHVGFNPGLLGISMHDPCVSNDPQKMRLPEWGCSGIYSMHNLDPKTYFAERDSAWRATVVVGPINQPDGAQPAEPNPAEAGSPPQN